jgi:hypothetical protein
MKSCHYHPEELLYNKHPQKFNVFAATATALGASAAISAGIGAATIGAGATLGAAALSSSAASKTAKSGQKQLAKQTEKTQEMAERLPYETGAVLRSNIPEYNQAAGELTAGTLKALEQFQPGSEQQRQQISQSISSLLGGKLTPDMMQNIAEIGGAGFNPFTAGRAGGFQTAQALYPKGSLAALKEGFGMFQSMMGLAPAFLTTSTQAGAMATNLGGLSAAALGGSYQAGANQIVGNIALANQQNQANMGMGSAIGGLGKAAGDIFGQAYQGNAGLQSSGFYGSQNAAANAYGVAPNQLSQQGGSGGGYYYNPSGTYKT